MLNFGPLSVPFAYAVFWVLVGWFRNLVSRLLPGREILLVLRSCILLGRLAGDSDNEVFSLVKKWLYGFCLW